RALRLRLDAHVEPDRAVEGSLLVEEEMGQLVGERRPIARRGEVALRLAPLADGAHHAADQLPHAALALGRAERAAEVLGDDDVGRELRPGPRHLDVALLEDGLAALAGDDRRADLPLDRLVRIGARRDEAPRDRQAAPRRALRRTRPSALLPSNRLRRHAQPPPGSAPYLAVPGLIHHYILCCQGFFSNVDAPAARSSSCSPAARRRTRSVAATACATSPVTSRRASSAATPLRSARVAGWRGVKSVQQSWSGMIEVSKVPMRSAWAAISLLSMPTSG